MPITKHIIVGMSGGVDSAVAAAELLKAGHHVAGLFMKNWESDDDDLHCSAALDLQDAQGVCDILGIPLHVVNFAQEYWENVFSHFLAEYAAGRTPNPDILCNKEIKFKVFLEHAKQLGADVMATGHYARNDANLLYKARDQNKDQSYFLHALTQQQLAQSLFPLGNMHKNEVRALAQRLGFLNHNKKDSTGICFIGERKFKPFLANYLPAKKGVIETLNGEQIGEHDGLLFYTIGQRQGLAIGGKSGKAELPWYVVRKDIARNALIVVQGDHEALYCRQLKVLAPHWIGKQPTAFPLISKAKTRYRQPDQACEIHLTEDQHLYVNFAQPQRAITPGQSIVFYEGELCLGGGIIAG